MVQIFICLVLEIYVNKHTETNKFSWHRVGTWSWRLNSIRQNVYYVKYINYQDLMRVELFHKTLIFACALVSVLVYKYRLLWKFHLYKLMIYWHIIRSGSSLCHMFRAGSNSKKNNTVVDLTLFNLARSLPGRGHAPLTLPLDPPLHIMWAICATKAKLQPIHFAPSQKDVRSSSWSTVIHTGYWQ